MVPGRGAFATIVALFGVSVITSAVADDTATASGENRRASQHSTFTRRGRKLTAVTLGG